MNQISDGFQNKYTSKLKINTRMNEHVQTDMPRSVKGTLFSFPSFLRHS